MTDTPSLFTSAIPEQGQLVRVRQRFWMVQDVVSDQPLANQAVTHRVLLECLDDDALGETLDVIWEREVAPQPYQSQGLPEPIAWDTDQRFDAFLAAVQWSNSSLLETDTIQAPFRAAITIEEYQLEPVVRALTMPRANLLIADDVGLGKTIEAGLVMQEMLARRRIRRVMIICPASLQQQWNDEMEEKFQLDFHIIDRDSMQQLRREYGMHVNPWASFPRLITSMDFIKREQPMRLFQESLQATDSPLRDWDLLVVDEAHNVAPSGRGSYAVSSDRTRMMRSIADHFEHRLFLTATPHNGYTESFTALLEMLDPLRFSRGSTVDQDQVRLVMVRRLKDTIKDPLGQRKFAERNVEALELRLAAHEAEMHDLLNEYTTSRLERVEWARSLPVRFALTMLKKRLLSSPLAFANSLKTHLTNLGAVTDAEPDAALVERMAERVNEDWADDVEKSLREDDALIESSRFFTELVPEERDLLTRLADLADPETIDSKAQELIDWIEAYLREDGTWTNERLIIFTEYKDTLDYLYGILGERYSEDRLLTLIGGMNLADREIIKAAFQAHPDAHPVRILVATDAASEGLNLQNYCRNLIHYEIPWNPNRMEQRNGRIDRHGQPAKVVNVYHFVYANHADTRFLETVVEKVKTMREDLGSVGDVIAEQVEEAMLGRRAELDVPEQRRQMVREVVRDQVLTDTQIREIVRRMNHAREDLDLYPATMANVLDQALKLIGHEGLLPATDPNLREQAYRLRGLPDSWRAAGRTLLDVHGRALDVTFDHELARQRKDVTLLHLNHPLMRRAVGVFRARIWSDGTDERAGLNRISYRVLPDNRLPHPVILAFERLVAIGALSQRLHEQVVVVGGEIDDRQVYALGEDEISHLLDIEGEYSPIPRETGDRLRQLFRFHERELQQLLEEREAQAHEALQALADQRAEQDAADVAQLMDERIRELDKRLQPETGQMRLFDLDTFEPEIRQEIEEDVAWLERKLAQLRERRDTEPQKVRASYQLKSVRIFPLAVLYLLPRKLLG
jgi:ERCC4-related helicase